MKKKSLSTAFLTAIIISGLILVVTVHFGTAQSGTNITPKTWNVDSGNYVNGVHNWNPYTTFSNNGTIQIDEPYTQWYILFTSIPTGSEGFTISLDANAQNLQGFEIAVMQNLPMVGQTDGFSCGIGPGTSSGAFDTQGRPYNGTGSFGGAWNSNGWTSTTAVKGTLSCNTWYNIVMTVTEQPYNVTCAIYDMNGTLIGSYSATSMTSPAFNQLSYIGFGASENGGNYTVENVTIASQPAPTPTPTATPTPSPTPSPTLPVPNLAVSCQSSASYSNFKVEITGSLTVGGTGISGVPVLLSYSVNEGNSWIGLTTATTDSSGNFFEDWFPSASGTYLLNAQWAGNTTYSNANTTISFAVLPYQEQNVFSISSNSTISAFAFNSTSQELSFSVSGPSGTTGYVDVYIPKSLISDVSGIKVYLDGNQLAYSTESQGDSWLLSFTYQHSTHAVVINLGSAPSTSFIQSQLGDLVIVGIAIATIAVVAVVLVLRKSKKGKS